MRKLIILTAVTGLLILLTACGSGGSTSTGKVVKSASVGNNLTAEISSADGVLKHGDQQFTVAFKDASGKPVDVGSASLSFFMPAMGSMAAMNDPATLTTTATPGVYDAKAHIEVGGEWQVKIAYDGPAGKGQTSFAVAAQ